MWIQVGLDVLCIGCCGIGFCGWLGVLGWCGFGLVWLGVGDVVVLVEWCLGCLLCYWLTLCWGFGLVFDWCFVGG